MPNLQSFFACPDRTVLRLSGPGSYDFLQGLISNDITRLKAEKAIYTAFLTPQGRYLYDFFCVADGDDILLDCAAPQAASLVQRLTFYRLRAQVQITREDSLSVGQGQTADLPGLAYIDPRLPPTLGFRTIAPKAALPLPTPDDLAFSETLRLSHGIPDGPRDLESGDSLLLDYNFDLLNAISWTKGCYMGQEITARMQYRGLLKYRLLPVRISGTAPPPGSVLIRNGVEVGTMRGGTGALGLACLKISELQDLQPIPTETGQVLPFIPDWMSGLLPSPQS
jgi:tRNA-modifying protein YgfZ